MRHKSAARLTLVIASLSIVSCLGGERTDRTRQAVGEREVTFPGDPIGLFPQSSDVAYGQFRYSIPIVAPPGRAKMQPGLSLDYSSRGPYGMTGWVGWAIGGLSQIT